MKFLHGNTPQTSCWQTYKALELIPDAVGDPPAKKLSFGFGLDQIWRHLLVALTQELVYEQQIEYLERCWAVNLLQPNDTESNTLQKLWTLMN